MNDNKTKRPMTERAEAFPLGMEMRSRNKLESSIVEMKIETKVTRHINFRNDLSVSYSMLEEIELISGEQLKTLQPKHEKDTMQNILKDIKSLLEDNIQNL